MKKAFSFVLLTALLLEVVAAFTSPSPFRGCIAGRLIEGRCSAEPRLPRKIDVTLSESASDDDFVLAESDQTVLGASGTVAALITLYSEFTIKTTGCGLPAGPFGLVGAAEGISYLAIVALAGLSLFKKIKTGSGLPAGPGGLLGAAEGLSFLAILAGLVVLGFQIADYGYIPNAVPSEGSICK